MNVGDLYESKERARTRAFGWSFGLLILAAAAIALVVSVVSSGGTAGSKATAAAAAGQAPSTRSQVTPPDHPDPNSPVVTTTLPLPDCIGVVDHFGTRRGCVKRDDLYPPDGSPSTATNVPVWDDAGNEAGYLVRGSIGFVDKATGDDPKTLADVQACFDAGLKPAPIDSHCSQVLATYGVRPVANPNP